MKIKLLVNLPVDKAHGARKGRIVEAEMVDITERERSGPLWYFTGDTGERVGVLRHEAEVVE